MQSGERAYRISAGIEDELGPLGAASVGEGDSVHAGIGEQGGEFIDHGHGSLGGLKGTDPGIAFDVVADVAGLDDMAGGKGGAANDELHTLGDEFFVAHSVLHGTDGAALIEKMRGLRDGDLSVRGFSRDNAVIAARKFFGIARCAQAGGEIGGAREAQAAGVDGINVGLGDIVGEDFGFAGARQMRGKQTAYRSATDDADFHGATAKW